MREREINFTDLVHECGSAQCAEEAIQERCPCFELVGYEIADEVPTLVDLIRSWVVHGGQVQRLQETKTTQHC